MGILVIYLIY